MCQCERFLKRIRTVDHSPDHPGTGTGTAGFPRHERIDVDHADIRTTEESYGHYDLSDLEWAMEQFAKGLGKDSN
jgi:hypothetical protein